MACNCPGSGCLCAEVSSESISVTGTGSGANPYIHEAIISPTACNQLSSTVTGLLVPGLTPTVLNQTSGNILLQNATCGVDTLIDPPGNRVLRGIPIGSTDAAWRPFISTDASNAAYAGTDGGVKVDTPGAGSTLPPGGTVCQVLGNSAPGVPAWIPRSVTTALFQDRPSIVINETVPIDGLFHSDFTSVYVYTNASDCDKFVLFQAQIILSEEIDYGIVSQDVVGEHNGGISCSRDVFGAVVAFTNTRFIGHRWNGLRASAPADLLGEFGEVAVWAMVPAGLTATFRLVSSAKNAAGMVAAGGGFTTELRTAYVIEWEA